MALEIKGEKGKYIILVLICICFIFSAAETRMFNIKARVGQKVILPCEGKKDYNCKNTVWLYNESNTALTLFEDGKIHDEAGDKSPRLSVRKNCSLVLKNVLEEDDGLYTCRHFESGHFRDSWVHLFVNNSE